MTTPDLKRFQRQILLQEVGVAGQTQLHEAKVLIVGMGGLGCPVALYLAAAGVGTLGIVDADTVDVSNLHRQVLFTMADVGLLKVEAAKQTLLAYYPECSINTYPERLSSQNALEILDAYDLVVDCSDNFPTRYCVNDASVLLKKPNVFASIYQFDGQVSVFGHSDGPCYRCLHPTPPKPGEVPNCAEAGVIGTLPGVMGLMQATETIKLIVGMGRPLIGRLVIYDALDASWDEFSVAKRFDCPVCGANPSINALVDYQVFCGVDTHFESVLPALTVDDLNSRVQSGEEVHLVDVREPHECAMGMIPHSINIPLSCFETAIEARGFEVTAPLIITCQKGPRSHRAAHILLEQGFTNIKVLEGGMDAYLKAQAAG